ncbi:MAG: type 1 glutamine amidotransferase [Solirubrobacterales bacterium]|nr:type 1 glutamine amidotransferase [Solirubrobacterales bacterium]
MKVLVLQHIACEHPGVFSEVMDERGVKVVAVELDEGDPLPDWREFDGVLAMGGPMGAGDDSEHPWLGDERRLVRDAVEAGRPFLGVCLGVQLLAAALGARVFSLESAEVGLLPVELTAEGRGSRLFAGIEEPLVCLQWHGDSFDLPEGSVRLGGSPLAPNQAFQSGDRAFGVQFHLEVTPEMARQWAEVPAYQASLTRSLGDEEGARFLAQIDARAAELHPAARRLFANWLDIAAG